MPNILLICADQWRGDCLSANSHSTVKTPVLDALAKESTLFAQHYTTAAPCGPARASLVTGQYTFNHRSVANGVPLAAHHTTMAQAAITAGLDCLLYGYTDTTPDPTTLPAAAPALKDYQSPAAGFFPMTIWRDEQDESWFSHLSSKGYPFSDNPLSILPQATDDANPQPFCNTPAPYKACDSDTAFMANQCIDYIRANGKKRDWFINLSFLRPHPPLIAPAPYNNLYPHSPSLPRLDYAAEEAQHPFFKAWLQFQQQPGYFQHGLITANATDEEQAEMRNVYYGLIHEVDYHIGRVLACLKETGLQDDTLVVFTSDHAEMLGERHCWGKGGYFDSAYHIPLIIHDPRLAKDQRGKRCEQFSLSVDIFPTLIDWLGAKPPRSVDGHSLLPQIHGNATNRDYAFYEFDFRHWGGAAIADFRQAYCLTPQSSALQVFRSKRYKYVHFTNELPSLLFDMQEDPNEFDNRINDVSLANVITDCRAGLLDHRIRSTQSLYANYLISKNGLQEKFNDTK